MNQHISREVLDAILKGIDEAIHVVDLTGTTIYYNDVAANHDGLKANEVVGKQLLHAFPALNSQSSTLLRVIHSSKPILNETQVYVNIHGKRIETVNSTYPLYVDGELVGAVEIAKDYTRLKAISDKLLHLQSRMFTPQQKGKKATQHLYTFDNLITLNKELMEIKNHAKKLASSPSPILVFGESGTGKELFVQAIHEASAVTKGPFITQNCAAIPEALLESILFGTTKGSYTGAVDRPGLFELADEGTLFLDEIHAMPPELQAKLLRILEDGELRRVGSVKSKTVHVRVIAAMNIHPKKAIEKKLLRADLYYRLNVLTFELPPLRKRKEDILYLTNYFIGQYNNLLGKQVQGLSKQAEFIFLNHSWPGNVRELKHTLEYMMNLCEESKLTENHLPIILKQKNEECPKMNSSSLREKMMKLEQELIQQALENSEGNINKAALFLQIPRQTLQYKIQKHNITAAENSAND
ncbi:sigma-54 interaction domain-containing protein [Cytobacillus gottheilii]|uniref:sigma-54 interaction domain-containing protein n=1 Tax=Cytobacillus gottheilii TaxID=859144 RepID=UPI0009BC6B45|nr:sigma 54-interacting transcriptional regulator [Cytobacillus gottheilii]